MFDFIRSKNKLWEIIIIPIFLLIMLFNAANAADSNAVFCYSGEKKIGELSAVKIDSAYWIPIKGVAQLLNMNVETGSFGDEVVVSNNNLTVKVVKNASAAKIGNMIIPLIEIPREIDGSLYLGERSLNVLFQRALGKKTENFVSFKMEYGSSDFTASAGEKSKEPVLYDAPNIRLERPEKFEKPEITKISEVQEAKTTPAPAAPVIQDKPDETAEISEIRWNVKQQKIRVVLACAGNKEPVLKIENDKVIVSSAKLPGDLRSRAEDRIQLKEENGSLVFSGNWQKVDTMVLENPKRVLIEFIFDGKVPEKAEPDIKEVVVNTPSKVPAKSNIVVLDPGHGGQDPGAVANGVREKEINLAVALKLEKVLKSKGIKVELTRRTDVYLKLAERTAIANNLNAEVFVSIHANALPKGKSARGFEIYLMALPTDKDALELAKFENRELADGSAGSGASDNKTQLLLSILGDMQQNYKIIESTDLAEVLYKAGGQSGLPMKRVAQAPFFVLRGAGMPAVLLETGFVTDKTESKLLAHSGYQQKIADAMALGIINYLGRK